MTTMLLVGSVLLAAAAGAAPAAAASDLFRLELPGNQVVWSMDRPMQSGGLILFHRFPDGTLLSVKRADVRRIEAARFSTSPERAMAPGNVIELGPTGGGARKPDARPAGANAARPLLPGEQKNGTALLNPDRPYRPDWDSKQVPGLNIPLPASPNDYREGKTFGFPSAASTQSAPGDLPRARVETGDPPKPPQ